MEIRKLEKMLYGYFIHYTIYFWFRKGRLPKSIEEFKQFLKQEMDTNAQLRMELSLLYSRVGSDKERYKQILDKVLRIWWKVIHKKHFQKLITKIKSLVGKVGGKCTFTYEKTYNLPILKQSKKSKKVIIKFRVIKPDLVIECGGIVVVVELKSGNRKLWKKYRKQIKEYVELLSKGVYKGKEVIGLLYYYKSGVLEVYNAQPRVGVLNTH